MVLVLLKVGRRGGGGSCPPNPHTHTQSKTRIGLITKSLQALGAIQTTAVCGIGRKVKHTVAYTGSHQHTCLGYN